MKEWDIYEEGFQVMGGSAKAHYLGKGYGETFLDACKEFISRGNRGEIRICKDGREVPMYWGCAWFPTLEEAQKSFG